MSAKHHLGNVAAGEFLFFFAYGIWLIASLVNISLFAPILGDFGYNFVRIVCIAALLLSEIMQGRYAAKTYVQLVVVVLLCCLVVSVSFSSIADSLLFILFGRNIGFKKFARVSLFIMAAVMALIVLGSQVGLVSDYVSGSGKHFLGFRYSLYPGTLFFSIVCLIIYLYHDKVSFLEASCLALVSLWLFLMTKGRLSFFLTLLLLLVFLVFRRRFLYSERPLRVLRLAPWCFVACFFLSVMLTAGYGAGVGPLHAIDEFLGGRLQLGYSAVQQYGISPFGKYILFMGNALTSEGDLAYAFTGGYNYVDSMYVLMLLRCGWLFTAVFLAAYTVATKRLLQKGENLLVLVLVFIAVHCMIDDLSLRLFFNPFLFILADLFSSPEQRSAFRGQDLSRQSDREKPMGAYRNAH